MAPRCPKCRWHLAFAAHDKSWEARCWNASCTVEVVPPSLNDDLIEYLRGGGEMDAVAVAERFDWSVPNANNHLTALLRVGVVQRRRIEPRRGGKRFAWRLA